MEVYRVYALSQECRLYAPFFAGPVPYINAFYGQGSGPIWLDYLRCTGNETSLLNCSHSGIGITRYYCGHDDDVGVECPGILVVVTLSVKGMVMLLVSGVAQHQCARPLHRERYTFLCNLLHRQHP